MTQKLLPLIAMIGILACSKDSEVATQTNDTKCKYEAEAVVSPGLATPVDGIIPFHADNYWVYEHTTLGEGGKVTSTVYDTVVPVSVVRRNGEDWWSFSKVYEKLSFRDGKIYALIGGQMDGCSYACGKYEVIAIGDTVEGGACKHTDIASRNQSHGLSESITAASHTFDNCVQHVDFHYDNLTPEMIEVVADGVGLLSRQLFNENGELTEEFTLVDYRIVN